MLLFLTGATGYIGGSVALQLLACGHRVRGLVRSAEGAAFLAAQGIEPVRGDLDDTALLTREAQCADGVVHTASADHAPSVHALIAGLAGSSKPLIHTSGASVVGDDARGQAPSGPVFDEDTPLAVDPRKQARRDIDLCVLAAATQGVRSAVICPSLVYGVGHGLKQDSVQIPFLVANARAQGRVQVVGQGLNVWSNVHLDDLVALYLRVLDQAPPGAFYFAENGEASFGDLGAAIATRLGLPGVVSLDPVVAAERWGVPRAYFSLGSNSRIRAVRARRELGWAPRHRAVTDWVLDEMPVDPLPASPH
jgi:nucleoside-diphosphate-sugar epimerase